MLKFKAAILELIVKGTSLTDVVDRMCREIERRFDGVACSVLTVDHSGVLHPFTAPSLPDAYCQALDNLAIGPNVGSCGTAAYTGLPVEVVDLAVDARWAPFPAFRKAALALGLRACWSSPLMDKAGLARATFALYFRDNRGPTDEERKFVSECLHLCDLAFARHDRVTDREYQASIDALTNLPNRGSFVKALAHLNCEDAGSWALLLIDLDNLKTVNDTFGHAAGDRLLQEVAQRLARFAVPDGVFRVGGDEFVLLVKDPHRLARLEGTAEDLFDLLSAPIAFEHFSVVPQATMGAAVVAGNEGGPDVVQRHADLALYHAKETRRGGLVRYWPGIETRMVARLSSIENVDLALREGRIDAWYQPIVRLSDRRVVALEALCRMVTPSGDVVSAAAFTDATSDARIASVLTQRMLSLVCKDMRTWLAMGIDFGRVGINITAVDLRGGRLEAALDEHCRDHDLLSRLVLEVTENVYIGDHDSVVIDAVKALKKRGVGIALDDFGTGYASLTHLLDLPVDYIKIDQSFIARLPGDEVSAAIISGLVEIAGKIGARVTPEGVETCAQAEKLVELGCTRGQGYHFARPADRSETARLLMRHGVTNPHSCPLSTPDAVHERLALPPRERRLRG